jgi:hypothetical protein
MQPQVIVYQLLAHGRWSLRLLPASSTTKTSRHDIAEILMKVALNTKNQLISQSYFTKYIDIAISHPLEYRISTLHHRKERFP